MSLDYIKRFAAFYKLDNYKSKDFKKGQEDQLFNFYINNATKKQKKALFREYKDSWLTGKTYLVVMLALTLFFGAFTVGGYYLAKIALKKSHPQVDVLMLEREVKELAGEVIKNQLVLGKTHLSANKYDKAFEVFTKIMSSSRNTPNICKDVTRICFDVGFMKARADDYENAARYINIPCKLNKKFTNDNEFDQDQILLHEEIRDAMTKYSKKKNVKPKGN